MLTWSLRLVPTCGRPIIQDMNIIYPRVHGSLGRSPGAYEQRECEYSVDRAGGTNRKQASCHIVGVSEFS